MGLAISPHDREWVPHARILAEQQPLLTRNAVPSCTPNVIRQHRTTEANQLVPYEFARLLRPLSFLQVFDRGANHPRKLEPRGLQMPWDSRERAAADSQVDAFSSQIECCVRLTGHRAERRIRAL